MITLTIDAAGWLVDPESSPGLTVLLHPSHEWGAGSPSLAHAIDQSWMDDENSVSFKPNLMQELAKQQFLLLSHLYA